MSTQERRSGRLSNASSAEASINLGVRRDLDSLYSSGAIIPTGSNESSKKKRRKGCPKRSTLFIANQRDDKSLSFWAQIFLHPAFENASLLLIVLNALWIGLDIDMNNTPDQALPKSFFELGETTFCLLFTLELLVRFLAYDRKENFFHDPELKKWNLFDCALVLLMIVDSWVLTYVVKVDTNQLRVMSTFRLARLLRMTRIFRLIPELGLLMKSMIAAIRSVASTCFLAVGVMYIFAILLTQWTKSYGSKGKCLGDNGDVCLQDYFGSLRYAFLSLFQILVFDATFELVKPIFEERVDIGLLIVAYILLVSFMILNMLIGIICDIVTETKEKDQKDLQLFHLETIFNELDVDGNGTVTRLEFFGGNATEQLKTLGLEKQVAKNAFDILDSNHDGELESKEFIRMILKCLNAPTSQDILEIEASVDKLADVLGFGRRAVAVTEKERKVTSKVVGSPKEFDKDLTSYAATVLRETLAETQEVRMRRAEEASVLERVRAVERGLVGVALLSKRSFTNDAGHGAISSLLTPENVQNVHDRTLLTHFSKSQHVARDTQAPPVPRQELMNFLRPSLRVLHARLHQLRAECKAAGMRYAGAMARGNAKLFAKESLQPLDLLIGEVLQRIESTGRALILPGFEPALPPPISRQRDMLSVEDTPTILYNV